MREYEAVTNLLPPWISGCDSWPRCFSPPNEKAQAGRGLPKFEVFTCSSGE